MIVSEALDNFFFFNLHQFTLPPAVFENAGLISEKGCVSVRWTHWGKPSRGGSWGWVRSE